MRVAAALACVVLALLLWQFWPGDGGERVVAQEEEAEFPSQKTRTSQPAAAEPTRKSRERTDAPASLLLELWVRDARGPVVGATVEAAPLLHERLPLDGLPAPQQTSTTGPGGRTRIAVRERGPWFVQARRGHEVSFPALLHAPGRVELPLGVPVEVHGEVLRADGAPAGGARLSFQFGATQLRGDAGADGRFRLPMVPRDRWDRLEITATLHPGDAPRCRFVFASDKLDGSALTLRMTDIRVRGRVVTEEGTPVRALVMPIDLVDPPAPADEDGRFAIRAQNRGAMEFLIHAAGFVPHVWTATPRSGDVKYKEPSIVLERGRPVSVRVVDPDGKPVARAQVRLERHDRRGRILPREEGQTSGAGTIRFDHVGTGPHDLYAFREFQPDLARPQLHLERIGDDVEVVLPHPILTTLRLSTHAAYPQLVVRDRAGTAIVIRDWAPWERHDTLRFAVWSEGPYDIDLRTTGHERAVVRGITVVQDHPRTIEVPLSPP